MSGQFARCAAFDLGQALENARLYREYLPVAVCTSTITNLIGLSSPTDPVTSEAKLYHT